MTKKEVSAEEIRVGQRIQELRKDVLKLDSQQAFADRLGGVTRGAVGNWERGQGIKRENLQRIAQKFRVSFEWLATGRGTPHSAEPDSSFDRMYAAFREVYGDDEAEDLREDWEREIEKRKSLLDRHSR